MKEGNEIQSLPYAKLTACYVPQNNALQYYFWNNASSVVEALLFRVLMQAEAGEVKRLLGAVALCRGWINSQDGDRSDLASGLNRLCVDRKRAVGEKEAV